MTEQDFVQLMCCHSFRRHDEKQRYECRCGVVIADKDLSLLPKKYGKELTTWLAYHFSNDPED